MQTGINVSHIDKEVAAVIQEEIIDVISLFPEQNRSGEMGVAVFNAMSQLLAPRPVTISHNVFTSGPAIEDKKIAKRIAKKIAKKTTRNRR